MVGRMWTLSWALLLMLGLGCQRVSVKVHPSFHFQPSDRVAFLNASERSYSGQGESIVNYLTNEFVEMDVHVVERALVDKVLEESGLDPKTAAQSELIAVIASSTNCNLVAFHVIESFSSDVLDPKKPDSGLRYRINGFLRIIEKGDNRVVVSATVDFSQNSQNEHSVLQSYAQALFNGIYAKLGKAKPPAPAPTPDSASDATEAEASP